jgi:hypothetical protein
VSIFAFMMKLHSMVAFVGCGSHFVMMMFAFGEGGAAAKRESQCEKNDGDGSEFHFFTLSTTIRVL